MKEEFITLETAKLMKNKGFSECVFTFYEADGVKSINGNPIYVVDNIPTIITNVKGNISKGFILHSDLSLTSCFIVKENN